MRQDWQNPAQQPTLERHQEMRSALHSVSIVADRALVRQVQRRVRERSLGMVERRKLVRQRIGMTLLACSLVWLLLTPILWGGYSQSVGWRHFADSEFQVMYLTGLLLPITLVTLVVAFLRTRSQKTERKLTSFVR
ncbi:MAG TPA: hypothetical protein VMU62_01230 [Acidobacteriaceae bacterium]|nr:hypothetical protein [Acidobacteriaceae bacterium]